MSTVAFNNDSFGPIDEGVMMIRLRTFSLGLVLAACSGTDIDATLEFAGHLDQICRIMSAASGDNMLMAKGLVDQFGDLERIDPCPSIQIDGDTATVTGECTQTNGVAITGWAVVVNPAGWQQIAFRGGDSRYEFHRFGIVESPGSSGQRTTTINGYIERRDWLRTWDADLTVDTRGLTVRSDLYFRCSDYTGQSCTINGSGIELPPVGVNSSGGAGGALVSGKDGDLTLVGADRLIVSFNHWQIPGTNRQGYCN